MWPINLFNPTRQALRNYIIGVEYGRMGGLQPTEWSKPAKTTPNNMSS